MQKKNTTMRKIIEGVLFFIALVALWQLIYIAGSEWFSWFTSYSMPNPLGVVENFIDLCQKGILVTALGYSMSRVFIGFLIAILIGLVLGLLITKVGFLNRNLKPLILGVQTLPSICWVPFAILWFGLNESAITFVVVMGSAFSVALSVESCILNVPTLYIKAAKTMGAKPFDLFVKVIWPASIPTLISGLKQGWSFAWRALMSGEVMSASIGLGQTLIMGRDLADINQVMDVMIIIILVGIIIDKFVFTNIENRVLRKSGLLN